MKGIIFTSFVEFVELHFGMDFVDELLEQHANSSGGSYTAVGTYPSNELLNMVGYIADNKDVDVPSMTRDFGEFTFGVLAERYNHLVSEYDDAISCLYHVDQTIHKNVKKLYPDAELPQMNAAIVDSGNGLEMSYQSARPLMYVAHGLIKGCVNHFNEPMTIEMTDLSDGAGNHARFKISRTK